MTTLPGFEPASTLAVAIAGAYGDPMTAVHLVTPDDDALAEAGQLLDAFNREYDEPTPGAARLAERLAELIADGDTVVLLADGQAGIAVVRLRKSIWSDQLEAYLAELYVVPSRRGAGVGRALMAACLHHARERGADYIDLVTSEDDVAARYLYAKSGFRRTEGDDGPLMVCFERDL